MPHAQGAYDMVVRSHEMFIPIPKPYTPAYDIKVNGTSVKNDVLKASFSKPVAEEGVGFLCDRA